MNSLRARAHAGPLRWQRYRPTREGISLLVVMTLIGFSAWHSGTNLLYLMFAMLIAFFLTQGLLVGLSLTRLDVEREVPSQISAQRPHEIVILVHNARRLVPSCALRVSDFLEKRDLFGVTYIAYAAARTTTRCTYSAYFPRRGIFRLSRMEILTRFPFGLVQRTAVFLLPEDVLVFPQEIKSHDVEAELELAAGDYQSHIKGAGSDLFGLHEYQAGEPVRHIHWRSSAKKQKLIVMEFEREERKFISLVLPNVLPAHVAPDPVVRDEFEKAVVMAAALSRRLVASGYELELVTDERNITHHPSTPQLTQILGYLAVIELTGGESKRLSAAHAASIIELRFSDHAAGLAGARILDVRAWQIREQSFVRTSI